MRAMTEIGWLDGRVTKVPELRLGDALGESVQAELDFGFDDVLEGLWVEVRHHEQDKDSDGDPRGRGCALYADCRYSLVEPSDTDHLERCRLAGAVGAEQPVHLALADMKAHVGHGILRLVAATEALGETARLEHVTHGFILSLPGARAEPPCPRALPFGFNIYGGARF